MKSPAVFATLFLPSVGQTRNPFSPSLRFGGRPRLCSVSSTLSYRVPIFMMSRASSAVATLRPNSRQSRTAPSTCWTEVRRFLSTPHRLSSLPTRTCWPSTIDMADSEIRARMLDQNVTDDGALGEMTLEKVHPVVFRFRPSVPPPYPAIAMLTGPISINRRGSGSRSTPTGE